MKQLEHGNILPFYGVATTVADFCLVFPWYENGNIMEYLEKKPGINRFDLASPFRQTPYYRCLPTLNSYRMWPVDCALCTKFVRRGTVP